MLPTIWNNYGQIGYFDDFFNDEAWRQDARRGLVRPRYEVEETKDHFVLTLETPGVPEDKLNIEVKDDVLTVQGEAKGKGKENGGTFAREFRAAFRLPEAVNGEAIEANYEHGVVTVALPKQASVKPRQIPVTKTKGFFEKLVGKTDSPQAA